MRDTTIIKRLQERFGDPIGSYAGNAPVGVRSVDETLVCPACGMMPLDGGCGCEESCSCGAPQGECTCDMSSGSCPGCGMLPINGVCGCSGLVEGAEPCAECGMLEVDESCGCTHTESDVLEVTPPGKEKMVKALKKDPSIDNPWAVAWAAKNKEKEG